MPPVHCANECAGLDWTHPGLSCVCRCDSLSCQIRGHRAFLRIRIAIYVYGNIVCAAMKI